MSVLLPGALGHQAILNRHKILTMKLSYALPLLIFSIYMQNCKILKLEMPNVQVLKFYFPIKESSTAQLELLTVDTLIQVMQRQENTVNKILLTII